jgi:hypothetical protein
LGLTKVMDVIKFDLLLELYLNLQLNFQDGV